MFTLNEASAELQEKAAKLQLVSGALLAGVTPAKSSQIIPVSTDLLRDSACNGLIFQIKEGCFTFKLREKALFVYEQGDILGFEFEYPEESAVVSSEFAVVVDAYKLEDFTLACGQDVQKGKLLRQYYQAQLHFLTNLIGDLMKSEVPLSPEFHRYNHGETIINQNDTGSEVYTLVEGKAEAFVDGVKVGTINRDEIFGMISAITGTPRTASVLAAGSCLALSVPNHKFLELIKNKPLTVLKLLEDMSKVIVELNKKIVNSNQVPL